MAKLTTTDQQEQADERERILSRLLHNESDVAYRRRVRTMLSYLDPQPGQVILDCGTGIGFYARTIHRLYRGVRVIGVDMDTHALAFARANLDSDILVAHADINRLPLATESVDSVLMSEVLEHLADEAAGLAEVHRALKPGASWRSRSLTTAIGDVMIPSTVYQRLSAGVPYAQGPLPESGQTTSVCTTPIVSDRC